MFLHSNLHKYVHILQYFCIKIQVLDITNIFFIGNYCIRIKLKRKATSFNLFKVLSTISL